jgi:LytS/YehU family sensor histidine kinase
VGVQTRLEEDLAETRAELAESRVRLLSGQIHPHFIFNSLSAIKALVSEDTTMAEQAIQDFSDYLRSHLDVMSSSRLVPFAEEMGHVSHYVSLEMADPSRPMQVTYDFETEDFMVPPLTVQPLVENAIRHGIRMREDGGTVEVRTRLADSAVLVSVRDNGRGLTSATERQEHRRKVGIDNVRERIERQCSGTLEVQSGPNGTNVTITIPRGEDL